MFGIEVIATALGKGLDKIFPDANVREEKALELAKLAFREIELELADRDSARKREMEVKDHVPAILAISISIAMISSMVYFNISPPVEASKSLIDDVMTALRDGWLVIMAYYFGSSNRSRSAK